MKGSDGEHAGARIPVFPLLVSSEAEPRLGNGTAALVVGDAALRAALQDEGGLIDASGAITPA